MLEPFSPTELLAFGDPFFRASLYRSAVNSRLAVRETALYQAMRITDREKSR